jgi:hypothetical protein
VSPAGRGGSAREEAERLVATVLAAAAMAARGGVSGDGGPAAGLGGLWSALGAAQRVLANPDLSTGEPACCVCPLCRLVTAMRDPSPEFAERLATGAGDVATGIAGIMRAFGEAGREPREPSAARDGTAAPPGGPAADGPDDAPADRPGPETGGHDVPAGRPDEPTGSGMPAGRPDEPTGSGVPAAPADARASSDVWRAATRQAPGPPIPQQASAHHRDDSREGATRPGDRS